MKKNNASDHLVKITRYGVEVDGREQDIENRVDLFERLSEAQKKELKSAEDLVEKLEYIVTTMGREQKIQEIIDGPNKYISGIILGATSMAILGVCIGVTHYLLA